MADTNKNKFITWLAWGPLKFSVLSLVLMTLGAVLYSVMANWIAGAPTPGGVLAAMGVGLALAVGAYIYMLPHDMLDRRGFIALNTAQTITASIAFLAAGLFFVLNANSLMNGLWLMRIQHSPSFLILAILVSLFYMYLAGIFVGNIYAKYLRARAMGASPWKIIFSMPFGLSMLWIAGYAVPEKAPKAAVINIRAKWYARLTDWIGARMTNTVLALAVLIAVGGFFFGTSHMLITIAMGLVFAGWLRMTGSECLRKSIPGIYSTVAVVLNIITIAAIFIIGNMHPSATQTATAPYEHIEISDVVAAGADE